MGLPGVVLAPLDLAGGLVHGIPGARSEAIIAAPLAAGRTCHAIVVAGRQDFSREDLDLLSRVAAEAAPWLALARSIRRLTGSGSCAKVRLPVADPR